MRRANAEAKVVAPAGSPLAHSKHDAKIPRMMRARTNAQAKLKHATPWICASSPPPYGPPDCRLQSPAEGGGRNRRTFEQTGEHRPQPANLTLLGAETDVARFNIVRTVPCPSADLPVPPLHALGR